MAALVETPVGAIPAAGPAITARGWLLIAGVTLAALSEAISGTVLATGRLDVIGDIHATPDELAWLDVGYTATKLVAFLIAPWLLGYLSGTVAIRSATGLLTLACGLAAATADTGLLAALRILQGFAGGVLLVTAQTALFQLFPKARQPFIQAIFAIGAVVSPAAFVPLTSGWTIDSFSWVWIFMSAFGIGLAALALIVASGPIPAEVENGSPDWVGLILFAAAAFSLSYVFNQGSRWNWFDESRIVWLSVGGSVALILFLISEIVARRERLLDLSVFRHQDFAFAFLVTFVAGFGLTGSSYLIPSFAVSVLGMTPTEAGWLLVPSGFVFIAALLAAALLIARCSLPPIATVPFGILFFMGAMWLLAGSSGESGIPDMMPGVMLRGLGLGMLFLSLTLIALADLPRASLAYGVALFNVGRLVGGQIGTAALQTLIDRETAQNVTVLAADVTNGQISVMDRLHQTTGLLAGRGLEAGSAAKAAVGLLGRQVTLQATVISFDDAFLTVALLFVAAAPFLIAWKLVLARLMRGQSSP